MGDRSVCERRSRGREKVLACGREKVQQHGRGSGCRCILGKGEQRLVSRVDVGVKVEEVRCVLKDGVQRHVCVYAAERWQGT